MAVPTRYSTLLNDNLRKQQKSYPDVGLSRQKIYTEKYQQQEFLCYSNRFRVCKLNYLSRWCLDVWSFTDEGLVKYPVWKEYMFFLPTLGGSASILRPK